MTTIALNCLHVVTLEYFSKHGQRCPLCVVSCEDCHPCAGGFDCPCACHDSIGVNRRFPVKRKEKRKINRTQPLKRRKTTKDHESTGEKKPVQSDPPRHFLSWMNGPCP